MLLASATAQICFEMCFSSLTVITTCHSSNLLRNVFFTTHWHPRGHVMPCRAIEIRPGGCSCISELIHESVPSDHRTRRFSQPPATSKKYRTASVCPFLISRLIQPLPLGTLGLLELLALWLGAGKENRAQGDDGLSMLKWCWVSFGRQLFAHFLGQQHQFLVQAIVLGRIQIGLRLIWARLWLFSRRRMLRSRRSQWCRTIPHQKKAQLPIDQLNKYHALGYAQPVPRSGSSNAYCMHPQEQSLVAAGECPSSQCWLQ